MAYTPINSDRSPLPGSAYSRPWCLVKRGGQVPGKRPSTMLFYAVSPTEDPAVIRGYVVIGSRHSKTQRPCVLRDIIRCWSQLPSPKAISEARAEIDIPSIQRVIFKMSKKPEAGDPGPDLLAALFKRGKKS